eukprot:903264-Prymnesium_polylepis.1
MADPRPPRTAGRNCGILWKSAHATRNLLWQHNSHSLSDNTIRAECCPLCARREGQPLTLAEEADFEVKYVIVCESREFVAEVIGEATAVAKGWPTVHGHCLRRPVASKVN